MKIKRLISLGLVLTMALSFVGCGEGRTENIEYPVQIYGETIETQPISVVSLSPSLTEICYDLGFEMTLDGVSNNCVLHDKTDAVFLGTAQNPNIEGILELKPDIVITNSPLTERDYKELLEADIKTIVFEAPKGIKEMWELYDDMGRVFSGKATGTDRAREKYEPYKYKIQKQKPIFDGAIAVFVPHSDIILKSENKLLEDFLAVLGARLATTDEEIKNAQIILAHKDADLEKVFGNELLKDSPAVKGKKAIAIDTDVLLRGGFDACQLIEDISMENFSLDFGEKEESPKEK